ncbi:MAG: hypothetical protein N2651_05480 [Fimbriimonadales bacterium]|nr:hypothetical protein [Fimbriimonadales bacterium]
MAIQARRERQGRFTDLWNRPIEWLHGLSLRPLEGFTQERWTTLLTILALVLANLVIVYFFLQGQDNRAIAFVILALIAPLVWLIPEFGILVFVTAGASLFVNAMYFAAGPGGGTGERTLILFFFGILSARALYEYVRTPREARPRLLSWLTGLLLIYWVYHMTHVAYIYLFQFENLPPDQVEVVLGYARPSIFRYFDYHMLWIGIFPIIILLRDFQRAKRFLIMLGLVMAIGMGSVLWEYFAPLPIFFKILFQLRAAGETEAGYRIRDPAPLYLFMMGFFFALYSVGYLRGWRNALAVFYILAAAFAIMATKNRILWAGVLLMLPIVLFWKPPQVLVRQAWVWGLVALFGSAGMFYPPINEAATRIVNETIERWSRNYAFGGDPRLDPSYLFRVNEREAWEHRMQSLTLSQRLFGAGLEATYGFYIPISRISGGVAAYDQTYVEKVHMHFAWLKRLLSIGWVGTALLAVVLVAFFVRAIVVFLQVKSPLTRAIVVGVAGAMIGVLSYDSLHTLLSRSEALPVILGWAFLELIPHWQRTGQLPEEDSAPAVNSA